MRYFFSSFACLCTLYLPLSAFAQIMVIGPSEAQSCYQATKMGDKGAPGTLSICKEALKTTLNRKDKASTHVNLGILLMRAEKYQDSLSQYEQALKIMPNLSEAYINYGAALIYMGDIDESLVALTKAIELETNKIPEALYNRSLAYDRKENYTAAYKDLKQALVLRPDWEPALKALEKYTVKRRS